MSTTAEICHSCTNPRNRLSPEANWFKNANGVPATTIRPACLAAGTADTRVVATQGAAGVAATPLTARGVASDQVDGTCQERAEKIRETGGRQSSYSLRVNPFYVGQGCGRVDHKLVEKTGILPGAFCYQQQDLTL